MPVKTIDDLFLHLLKDMYNAEKQLTKALPKMAKNAASPDLKKAFETHLVETEGQIERLEAIFEQIGKQSELGVTWMTIILERTGRPGVPTLEKFVERVESFGAEVIRKLPRASGSR